MEIVSTIKTRLVEDGGYTSEEVYTTLNRGDELWEFGAMLDLRLNLGIDHAPDINGINQWEEYPAGDTSKKKVVRTRYINIPSEMFGAIRELMYRSELLNQADLLNQPDVVTRNKEQCDG